MRSTRITARPEQEWVARMRGYVQAGYAFDLVENEDRIRCVAAASDQRGWTGRHPAPPMITQPKPRTRRRRGGRRK